LIYYKIAPKVNILNIPSSSTYKSNLSSQLSSDKKFYDMNDSMLSYLYESSYINSSYITNVFLERNEVNLFKEIEKKSIMNG